jgi:hypothetical protein
MVEAVDSAGTDVVTQTPDTITFLRRFRACVRAGRTPPASRRDFD